MSKLKTLLFVFAAAVAVLSLQSCGTTCEDVVTPEGFTCVDGDNGPEFTLSDACFNVSCPDGYTCDGNGDCVFATFQTITKAGFISADETWSAANVYVLIGKVVVPDGVTLTIEPGTIVKGSEGTGILASALVIARGGKLIADGTADAPIIFTSTTDDIEPGQTEGTNLNASNSGLWGGLIVLGKATISVEDNSGEAQIEGIPADDSFGAYGGGMTPDDADNSGILRYVSVRHGGASIGADNEINGITFGGVGTGTVVENIEVVGNLDDGVEFFGGTVNATNVIVNGADDDAIDLDQAYSGIIDNAVVIAIDGTDHGLEIDGPEGNIAGAFTVTNLTVKGFNDELGQYRDAATGTTSNAFFFGFQTTVDGEGDLSLQKDDDGNYTTLLSDLTFSNIEVVLVDGVALTDMLKDGIDAFGTAVTAGTVGADTSVFDWTFSKSIGDLDF